MRHAIFHAKFSHWTTTNDFVDNKCFLYKFDTNKGYHHTDFDDNYQKYLGLSWKIDGKLFTPFIFPKVMPCLVVTLEKVRDKKFVYLLTTVLDPLSPSPSLDLVRKKQTSLKTA